MLKRKRSRRQRILSCGKVLQGLRIAGSREKLVLIYIYTHRIHGAAIYGNMDPINIPPRLAYIPAPWILWLMGYIDIL